MTLQVFLIAMMGLTLGVRGGLTAYGAVLVLTLCGLPMMAGGRGGAAVLLGPTCGYIYGWVFLLVLLGLYADRGMPRLLHKKLWGMSIHLPVSFAVGLAGLALDYLCGSAAPAAGRWPRCRRCCCPAWRFCPGISSSWGWPPFSPCAYLPSRRSAG